VRAIYILQHPTRVLVETTDVGGTATTSTWWPEEGKLELAHLSRGGRDDFTNPARHVPTSHLRAVKALEQGRCPAGWELYDDFGHPLHEGAECPLIFEGEEVEA